MQEDSETQAMSSWDNCSTLKRTVSPTVFALRLQPTLVSADKHYFDSHLTRRKKVCEAPANMLA